MAENLMVKKCTKKIVKILQKYNCALKPFVILDETGVHPDVQIVYKGDPLPVEEEKEEKVEIILPDGTNAS